jgi:hypothetical protein
MNLLSSTIRYIILTAIAVVIYCIVMPFVWLGDLLWRIDQEEQ